MPAYRPEECDQLLIDAITNEDVDAAVALYEPDAAFVVAPGQVVSGHAAIREIMRGFVVASKEPYALEGVTAIHSADGSLAVMRMRGRTSVPGPYGKPVTMQFHSVEVVRRQPDGTWRFVIDDPTGECSSTAPESLAPGSVPEEQ